MKGGRREQMRETKVISFYKNDYKKIIDGIREDTKDRKGFLKVFPLMLIPFELMGLISWPILDSLIFFWVINILIFFGFVMFIIGGYLCIINDLDTSNWGISFAPLISWGMAFYFLKGVSFDNGFIVIGSIAIAWIFTKFCLSQLIKSNSD